MVIYWPMAIIGGILILIGLRKSYPLWIKSKSEVSRNIFDDQLIVTLFLVLGGLMLGLGLVGLIGLPY